MHLKMEAWGAPWGGGWMGWPAGLLTRLRLVKNVYNAWTAYTRAENRAVWSKKPENATANEIVGIVRSYRYEAPDEETRMERWEGWLRHG